MRTFVESDGSIATGVSRQGGRECGTYRITFRRQQDINRLRCVTTRPHGQRARPPPSS